MTSAPICPASDPDAVLEAARIIRRGGLVVFPTETVYGLGADACNPLAVARIFEIKRRPRLDPIIVHVADPPSANFYGSLPPEAAPLVSRFWPGPLTLVVPRKERIPPIVTAGLETVAIRMPAHPAALALIRASKTALAAPSANLFGSVSPTEVGHLVAQLSDQVDLILDGGRCQVGVESTVLSIAGPGPEVLRAGGVPVEMLEEVLGPLSLSTDSQVRPQSPGQLSRHYAPRTPLDILDPGSAEARPGAGERVGLLAFRNPADLAEFATVEVLSKSGDLREAAANLFAALHRLDRRQLDRIVAEPVPEHGLGIAIMDRLRRASNRNDP